MKVENVKLRKGMYNKKELFTLLNALNIKYVRKNTRLELATLLYDNNF